VFLVTSRRPGGVLPSGRKGQAGNTVNNVDRWQKRLRWMFG
jgi:hypothetical protein